MTEITEDTMTIIEQEPNENMQPATIITQTCSINLLSDWPTTPFTWHPNNDPLSAGDKVIFINSSGVKIVLIFGGFIDDPIGYVLRKGHSKTIELSGQTGILHFNVSEVTGDPTGEIVID